MNMKSALLILTALITAPLQANAIKGKKELLLENNKIEVVRVTYPAGTESGFHTHKHPHRVVYVVSGGKLKMIPAENHDKARTLTVKTGDTLFVPANSHNVINVGDTTVVLVETELKQ